MWHQTPLTSPQAVTQCSEFRSSTYQVLVLILFFVIGGNGSWQSQETFILQLDAVGNSSRNVPVPLVFHKEEWNQEKLPEVKDAENIASDHLSRIGAQCMYIGKAGKVATMQWMHNPDVFIVAIGWWPLNFRCRLSIFEFWGNLQRLFGESLQKLF